jgi:hypothetical protein
MLGKPQRAVGRGGQDRDIRFGVPQDLSHGASQQPLAEDPTVAPDQDEIDLAARCHPRNGLVDRG